MIYKTLLFAFIPLSFLATGCLTKQDSNYRVGTTHYLRIPIYNTANSVTTIHQGIVTYLSEPICPDELELLIDSGAYPEPVVYFPKGNMVSIVSLESMRDETWVSVQSNDLSAELCFRSVGRGTRNDAFEVIFSPSPLESGEPLTYEMLLERGKTESDIVQLLGPPLSICENAKNGERYLYYNSWLLQMELGGFHDFFVEIKEGRIAKVFGLY